jgi:inner membrane protein
MFVADPLFSIWPAIAAIALAVMSVASKRRLTIATTAIVLSSVYLAVGIFNKTSIDSIAKKQLHNKGVSTEQYFSTPTPLNNLLWYIVTKTDSGFQIGYRSVLDSGRNINFRYTPQNAHLLQQSAYPDDVKRLIRFSQGFYTASMWHDTLVLNNLRFGEINGWADTMPQCVFYYFTDIPDGNDLVVQRGRFAKWNAATLSTFLARIFGH